MKILFAAPVIDSRQMDMARVFRAIGEEMQRRGHVVHYFLEDEAPPLWVKQASLLEWGMRAAPLLGRKCRRNTYDAVIMASASGWILSTYRKWLLPRKTRIVSWHHGYEACLWPHLLADEKNGNGKLSKVFKIYYNAVIHANRQSFLTQDGALFTSTEDRDWAQNQYPLHAPKALYQPNGVSPQYYYPQRYAIPLDEESPRLAFPPLDAFPLTRSALPRLLFVGDWPPARKTLPRVFERLRGQYPQLRLSLVGPKLEQDEVLSAFPPELRSAVTVARPHDDLDRIEAYQRHDIFICPTLHEGMPLAILEAMASAMPVVTTHHNGVQDVIVDGENGLLTPKHNINAQVEALRRLIESPRLCQTLGLAAFETASRCYTWRQVTDIFEENLYRVLHKKFPLPDWMMANP